MLSLWERIPKHELPFSSLIGNLTQMPRLGNLGTVPGCTRPVSKLVLYMRVLLQRIQNTVKLKHNLASRSFIIASFSVSLYSVLREVSDMILAFCVVCFDVTPKQ